MFDEQNLFNNVINNQIKFNTQNLKFFYFDISKLYKSDYIIYNYKKIIFRKIYIFNKYIYNYIFFINELIIKDNLFFYFRESILN